MATRHANFKSCDYCRHRRKRCVTAAGAVRCSDCQHLNLACEFSPRQPSEKRRAKSRRIAAQLGVSSPSGQSPRSDDEERNDQEIAIANLKPGDCQLPLAGRRDMANKRLFHSNPSTRDSEYQNHSIPLSSRYWKDVHPFWPFVTPEMLDCGETGRFPECMLAVDLACNLSLNIMEESESLTQMSREVMATLQRTRLSMPMIAGVLLLSNFLYFEEELLQRVSACIPHHTNNMVISNAGARSLTTSSMSMLAVQTQFQLLSLLAHLSPTSGGDWPATAIHRSTFRPIFCSDTLNHRIQKSLDIIICAFLATRENSTSCRWHTRRRAFNQVQHRAGRGWSTNVCSGRYACLRPYSTRVMTSQRRPSRS